MEIHNVEYAKEIKDRYDRINREIEEIYEIYILRREERKRIIAEAEAINLQVKPQNKKKTLRSVVGI